MWPKLLVAGLAGLASLAATAALAVPAQTTNPLNLRSGPGTRFPVVTTIPAGSTVDVGECQGSWCPVSWQRYSGYASGNFLQAGASAVGPAPAAVPSVAPGVAVAPPYYDGYYGDGYYGDYYGDGYWDGAYWAAPVLIGGRWWYGGRWYNHRPNWRPRHGNNNRNDGWRGGNPRNNRAANNARSGGNIASRTVTTRQDFGYRGNVGNRGGYRAYGGSGYRSYSGGGGYRSYSGGGYNRGFSRGGGGGATWRMGGGGGGGGGGGRRGR